MQLKLDDHNGVYVWTDDSDEKIELSPHFDYEADAIQWYHRIQKDLYSFLKKFE